MTFEFNPYSRGRIVKKLWDMGYTYDQLSEDFGLSVQQLKLLLNHQYHKAREEKHKQQAKAELDLALERGDLRYLLPILPNLQLLVNGD